MCRPVAQLFVEVMYAEQLNTVICQWGSCVRVTELAGKQNNLSGPGTTCVQPAGLIDMFMRPILCESMSCTQVVQAQVLSLNNRV